MEYSGIQNLLHNQPEQYAASLGSYWQEQLEFVLNAMPVAVSMSSLEDFSIKFCNKRFIELFGYEEGEFATVNEWVGSVYVNQKQVERARAIWNLDFMEQATRPFEMEQLEVDVLCKNGEVKTCLLGGMVFPMEKWGIVIYTDISDRKVYEEKIRRLALEDDLTGLKNRRGFKTAVKKQLAHASRHQTRAALLLIDMDNFKYLNDNFGHDTGDQALQLIAEHLNSCTRESDITARLGGDEFAVMLDMINSEEEALEVARRIIDENPTLDIAIDDQSRVSVSIGIALFPDDGLELSTLLKKADQALYRVKDQGKGNWSR